MRLSIAAKINFFLLFLFSTVLVISSAYQGVRERDLILSLIRERGQEQAEAYFDAINILMLTGKMEVRDTLRGKFHAHSHVIDARIVRGEAVNRQYGPGNQHEVPQDEFDRLALAGKASLEELHDNDGERHNRLVVTLPLLAKSDMRGTDCTNCHKVPVNTVLGAIRFDYSLDDLYAKVEQNILTWALSLTVIFSLGLLLTLWVIRTWIVHPLNQMTRSIEEAADMDDIGHRLEGDEGNEVGRLALAYNQMLDSVARRLRRPRTPEQNEQDKH